MVAASISELHNAIAASMQLVPEVTVTTSHLESDVKRKLRDDLSGSTYTLKELSSFIDSTQYLTTLVCGGATLNVMHRGEAVNQDVPLETLVSAVKRTVCMLMVCKTEQNMVFWLLPSPCLKTFPRPSKDMSVSHANSAFTYINGNSVYIYRREEFAKVMLHETLHHVHSIDTYNEWSQPQLQKIFTIFRIHPSTKLRPNEAVVETWAELFHIAFLCNQYEFDFDTIYKMEFKWAILQAKRILRKQGTYAWREESHAYSYYVLRSLFMMRLTDFMSLTEKKDIDGLINLAVSVFTGDEYKRAIHSIKISRHSSFRMTMFGDL